MITVLGVLTATFTFSLTRIDIYSVHHEEPCIILKGYLKLMKVIFKSAESIWGVKLHSDHFAYGYDSYKMLSNFSLVIKGCIYCHLFN